MTAHLPGDIGPGATVKVASRTASNRAGKPHYFVPGTVAEVLALGETGEDGSRFWLVQGPPANPHLVPQKAFQQIVHEADLMLTAAPPPPEPQPHPEKVPNMSDVRGVLAATYLLATDEEIERAITSLKFELDVVRQYRKPAAKEESDV